MKAAVLKSAGKLALEEIAAPPCPPGGLLVRVRACSVCSSDARMLREGHRALAYPRILGHEVAGEVMESRSKQFQTGDRVQLYPGIPCGQCPPCRRGQENHCRELGIVGFTYDGGFAEAVAVPARSLAGGGVNPLPDGMSYQEASLAEPLASCLNGQELAGVGRPDSVLILGAGPIGLLHAILAGLNGAKKIYMAERLPGRLKAPEEAAIDRMIDTAGEDIKAVIDRESGGRGVDVIIVACSQADASSLPEMLAPRGRLCLFSGLADGDIKLDANLCHYRELTMVGAYGSTAAQNSAAVELIAGGGVPAGSLITARFPLEGIADAMDYVSRRQGLKAAITFP